MADGLIAAVAQKGVVDQDNTTVVAVRIEDAKASATDDATTRVCCGRSPEDADLRTRRIGVTGRKTVAPGHLLANANGGMAGRSRRVLPVLCRGDPVAIAAVYDHLHPRGDNVRPPVPPQWPLRSPQPQMPPIRQLQTLRGRESQPSPHRRRRLTRLKRRSQTRPRRRPRPKVAPPSLQRALRPRLPKAAQPPIQQQATPVPPPSTPTAPPDSPSDPSALLPPPQAPGTASGDTAGGAPVPTKPSGPTRNAKSNGNQDGGRRRRGPRTYPRTCQRKYLQGAAQGRPAVGLQQ